MSTSDTCTCVRCPDTLSLNVFSQAKTQNPSSHVSHLTTSVPVLRRRVCQCLLLLGSAIFLRGSTAVMVKVRLAPTHPRAFLTDDPTTLEVAFVLHNRSAQAVMCHADGGDRCPWAHARTPCFYPRQAVTERTASGMHIYTHKPADNCPIS